MASSTPSRPPTPNQSDDDDDSSSVGGITSKCSNTEFRKQVGNLIDDLNDYSMTDGADSSMKKMERNLKKSKKLLETFEGQTEMYLACLHTKKLSEVVRDTTDHIANSNPTFDLDKFVDVLKSNNSDESGKYSRTELATSVVNSEASKDTKTAPALSCMYGLFEKESLSGCAPPKAKKPRLARKKQDFQTTNATQHVEVNVTEQQGAAKDTSAVKHSMDLLNILQQKYKQDKKPTSLYDFTMDTTSLAKTVENMFHLGFLVRDGRISVKREGAANLVLKPETPPEKEEGAERQQHILSFSSRQWKALAAAAEGENTIKSYQEAQSKEPPKE